MSPLRDERCSAGALLARETDTLAIPSLRCSVAWEGGGHGSASTRLILLSALRNAVSYPARRCATAYPRASAARARLSLRGLIDRGAGRTGPVPFNTVRQSSDSLDQLERRRPLHSAHFSPGAASRPWPRGLCCGQPNLEVEQTPRSEVATWLSLTPPPDAVAEPEPSGVVELDAELVLTRVICRRWPGIAVNTRVIVEPSACGRERVMDPRQRSKVTLCDFEEEPDVGSDELELLLEHVVTPFSVTHEEEGEEDLGLNDIFGVGPMFTLRTALPLAFTRARQRASTV